MPEVDFSFSNPSAPLGFNDDDYEGGDGGGSNPNLSNADFRKLLMTPGARRTVSSASAAGATGGDARKKAGDKKKGGNENGESEEADERQSRWERRKKRKQYFAKLLKQQQDREEELNNKYRDRAKERRDGKIDDTDDTELLQTSADYRAVAPDASAFKTAADRRKQAIENSKYLGGDMEHTHLVKGLDFALLQKVRAEISTKEEEDAQLETYVSTQQLEKEDFVPEFKSTLARNIFNVINRKYPEKNENFFPGRMFYRVDLEDDPLDALATDIPTAILRSKADCPVTESQLKDATNDMVINHLAQILSYLRHGDKHRKGRKRHLGANEKYTSYNDRDYGHSSRGVGGDYKTEAVDNIFDDVGDYLPKDKNRSGGRHHDYHHSQHHHGGGRHRNEERREDRHEHGRGRTGEGGGAHRYSASSKEGGSYFDKPADTRILDDGWSQSLEKRRDQFRKRVVEEDEPTGDDSISAAKRIASELEKRPLKTVPDGYFECYPDAAGFAGGMDDSDDDIDWTKMDMGNKKGPVGRWDFETQEEYSSYMSSKEALPKAAFQFGVKMNDGRKTRKQHVGPKDEKKALDREWEQISKIIDRRKGEAV